MSKAFLSDRAGRLEYGAGWTAEDPGRDDLRLFNGRKAEQEARRILAETEPQSLYSRLGRLDCVDLSSGWRVASEPREALEESLRWAFVDLATLALASAVDDGGGNVNALAYQLRARNLATLDRIGARQ